jgi:thiamine biosynthesis lipoprotein
MTPELVKSLLSCIGYKRVAIVKDRLVKEDPCILLDFNAVAQGFSVDYLSNFLISKGISNFLIDIGGEVRGQGTKPSAESWVVAIEKPAPTMDSEQQLKAKLKLNDHSLATSGNYRKYIEEDGIRYSHTIDPSTGYPARHNLLSVSVIAPDCMTADAYATAFMVMGLEKTRQFLAANKDLNLHVYCIYSASDGTMQTWTDPEFQKLIISEEP